MVHRRPRVLVFQHMSLAHPGLFRDCMRADGVAWDVVALEAGDAIPALEDYDALLVMGGAQDVWQEAEHPWLVAEKRAIRAAVLEHGMAYLGICLGHQLLADALGGEVRPAARPEIGMFEVGLTGAGRRHPLFAGLPPAHPFLQSHAAEVMRPPPGAEVLARSDRCAVQALALGRRVVGLQYHAEVDGATLDDWLGAPSVIDDLRRALGPDGPARFAGEARAQMEACNAAAWRIWANLMAMLRPGVP